MSTPLDNFENNELSGPYSVNDIPELLGMITEFVEASSLTEKGRAIRIGQLTSKLMKCTASAWPGLTMAAEGFKTVEIFVDRDGDQLDIKPMIISDQGNAFDLQEASGKVDFIIPQAEILRRAKMVRQERE